MKISTFDEIVEAVAVRWISKKVVRRNLPGGGYLRIDRPLPFLCIYRSLPNSEDPGTRELVTSEAAYLLASSSSEFAEGFKRLVERIGELSREEFGKFLIIEVWSATQEGRTDIDSVAQRPSFEIVSSTSPVMQAPVAKTRQALSGIKIARQSADTTIRYSDTRTQPDMTPLLPGSAKEADGWFWLGLAVRPIYRGAGGAPLYPVVLQSLRRDLAVVLRKAVSAFADSAQQEEQWQYQSLGPSSLAKSVRLVDQQLCDISESFDFLLQVTPVNSDEAWKAFRESQFRRVPHLQYRPLPYHPELLKRQLFSIPLERIDDPTLSALFRQKQEELDHQLTAIRDMGTERFLYGSLQLYGRPDANLRELAHSILEHPRLKLRTARKPDFVSAEMLVARAREEIDGYHQQMSAFSGTVELCNTITSGVMVAQDRLYVSQTSRFGTERIESLLHHEVGTHLLTYFNGRAQRFRQLYAGLAGYEELQEGLAVLAEYLTGGLSAARLRTLAGRVVAVQARIEGLSFVDTFRLLCDEHDFTRRKAFATTLRVCRAGGLTKDIIYLRGLSNLLDYLKEGHELESLYVGKIGLQHVPLLQELRQRGIIQPPAILPRFLNDPKAKSRLDHCRGRSLRQLLENSI